ncbi:hypothetical protein EON66_11635 [archaeon]|nr:MAG: hypothetical protein EON66_11635 [archaeon]
MVWQSVFTTVAPTEAAMARDQLPRNVYVCPSQPPSGVRISSEADTLFAKRVMDALYPGSLWFEPRVDASAAGEGSAWADSTSDTDDASASQEADTNVASAATPSDAAQVEPTHVVACAPAPASAPAPAAEAAEAEFDIMAALAVLKADDEL